MYAEAMRQVILYPDHDAGGWVAEVPSLPGCVSEGETREEALSNIREAIEGWIAIAREHGDPVPDDTLEAQMYVVEVASPADAA